MATRRPGHAGRGGPRTATPGTNYTNRTDLQARQPVATAPGQAYGVATQQVTAQHAVPLPGGGLNAGTSTGPQRMAGSGGMAGDMPPVSGPLPGSLGLLHAPTNRPAEPLTHGLPTGPGGGPEVLQPPDPLTKAAAVLNNLGATADPDTARLRAFINATLGNKGAA